MKPTLLYWAVGAVIFLGKAARADVAVEPFEELGAEQTSIWSQPQTWVAGVLLSAAIVVGGLLLARRNRGKAD